jgi:hypothetical protein
MTSYSKKQLRLTLNLVINCWCLAGKCILKAELCHYPNQVELIAVSTEYFNIAASRATHFEASIGFIMDQPRLWHTVKRALC